MQRKAFSPGPSLPGVPLLPCTGLADTYSDNPTLSAWPGTALKRTHLFFMRSSPARVRARETESSEIRETDPCLSLSARPPLPAGPWQCDVSDHPSPAWHPAQDRAPPPTGLHLAQTARPASSPSASRSPRMLLREASPPQSLGRPPGLGARRVARPAVWSPPLPGRASRGVPVRPGSVCPRWPPVPQSWVSIRGSHWACFSKTVSGRAALSTGNSHSCMGPSPSCSCPLKAGHSH